MWGGPCSSSSNLFAGGLVKTSCSRAGLRESQKSGTARRVRPGPRHGRGRPSVPHSGCPRRRFSCSLGFHVCVPEGCAVRLCPGFPASGQSSPLNPSTRTPLPLRQPESSVRSRPKVGTSRAACGLRGLSFSSALPQAPARAACRYRCPPAVPTQAAPSRPRVAGGRLPAGGHPPAKNTDPGPGEHSVPPSRGGPSVGRGAGRKGYAGRVGSACEQSGALPRQPPRR